MFNLYLAVLLAVGIVGSLIAIVADKQNSQKTWKICMYYFAVYAAVMAAFPIVAVVRHWTIFDKVSGLFVVALVSALASIYIKIKLRNDNKHYG